MVERPLRICRWRGRLSTSFVGGCEYASMSGASRRELRFPHHGVSLSTQRGTMSRRTTSHSARDRRCGRRRERERSTRGGDARPRREKRRNEQGRVDRLIGRERVSEPSSTSHHRAIGARVMPRNPLSRTSSTKGGRQDQACARAFREIDRAGAKNEEARRSWRKAPPQARSRAASPRGPARTVWSIKRRYSAKFQDFPAARACAARASQ